MPTQPIEIAHPYTFDVEHSNRFRRVTSNPIGTEYTHRPELNTKDNY